MIRRSMPDSVVLISGNLDDQLHHLLLSCIEDEVPLGWARPKTESSARVYGGGDERVFIKVFDGPESFRFWHRVTRWRQERRIRRIIRNDLRMRKNGFLSPETVAAGFIGSVSFLISRELPGEALAKVFNRASWLEKSNICRELAKEIAKLHGSGLYHGDLNPYNIHVWTESKAARFAFLDNEQNLGLGFFWRDRALSDLRRLNRRRQVYQPGLSLKITFLRTYLGSLNRLREFRAWQTWLSAKYAVDLNRRAKKGR